MITQLLNFMTEISVLKYRPILILIVKASLTQLMLMTNDKIYMKTNQRKKYKSIDIPITTNINSLKNKFGFFLLQINKNVDTPLLSEPKLNDSFPVAQF